MENLTKQQIVLVTLLVSFVTSMATGIVTVSLMDQAPQGVTQTINRVVERTIERVVQAPSQAAVVTKETVVVKEDELVVSAIEKNAKSLVRIIYPTSSEENIVALGLIVSREGTVIVDSLSVYGADNYEARLSDGKTYPLKRVFDAKNAPFSVFKIVPPEGQTLDFAFATLADSDKIKLGQSLVFLGGKNQTVIETGLVSSIEYEKPAVVTDQATTTDEADVSRKVVSISLSVQPKSLLGGIVSNLSSEIIAFQLVSDASRFIPSNQVSSILSSYTASLTSTTTSSSKATN